MNLLPKSRTEFTDKNYWNNFFEKRGKKAFEWYGEYPELCGQLHKYIKPNDKTLIVGCGNSNLSSDLYDVGFKNITNIDISHVSIRRMESIHAKLRPEMKWLEMDALEMTFPDSTFKVTVDKGTLDALLSDDTTEIREQAQTYLRGIDRVTAVGGRYLCVSLLQEHVLRELLRYFPGNQWLFRVVRCLEVEQKLSDEGESSMPVFMVVCTKFKQLAAAILEWSPLGDKMHRLQSPDEVLSTIKSVQQTALICSKLTKSNIADEGEISMELFRPDETISRYILYIVDEPFDRKKGHYAAFIVPQGRETEWLFATKEGRRKLAKSANFNRLTVVTMNRHQQNYGDLKTVQQELNNSIRELAPNNSGKQIPFLSLGNDIGERKIIFQGNSEFAGDFVVEDFVGDGNESFRRLIFLNNQNIVQSETKLKNAKSRKDKTQQKLIPDPKYLACLYHVYMAIGLQSVRNRTQDQPADVAVVGLGGGGLCTFLQMCLVKLKLTAIDIDAAIVQVAVDYFGLVKNERLQVVVQDGLEFLKEAAQKDKKFQAILFDIDNKDSSLGMSCPPKPFLESPVLENVKHCLLDSGIFILNLVVRDEQLRQPIIESLKSKFESVITFKLTDDLNEIIYCYCERGVDWMKELELAAKQLNSIAKTKQLQPKDEVAVDVESFLETLTNQTQ